MKFLTPNISLFSKSSNISIFICMKCRLTYRIDFFSRSHSSFISCVQFRRVIVARGFVDRWRKLRTNIRECRLFDPYTYSLFIKIEIQLAVSLDHRNLRALFPPSFSSHLISCDLLSLKVGYTIASCETGRFESPLISSLQAKRHLARIRVTCSTLSSR